MAASASIQGIQVDGTYAVTDLLAARIGYQTRIAKGKIYHLPTGGFGVYQSLDQWRFGAFVDVGGGYAFNRETITITSGNSTSTEVYTNAGPMFQGALTVHAGAKQKFMEEGVELQVTYHLLSHNRLSDFDGTTGQDLALLPIGFWRVGNEHFQAGAFLGVDIPVYRRGELGQPFPFLAGVNLQFNFSTLSAARAGTP